MTTQFYDDLSEYYHLIFQDWDSAITRQAARIDQIISNEWGANLNTLVDVSCGIGTQSIGLAQLGYDVHASDISRKAIERARLESSKRGVNIDCRVVDMRKCHSAYMREFDILISCDNSIPHLLSDDEILSTFKEFHKCLKPKGGCLISIRDYSNENKNGIKVKPYQIKQVGQTKYIFFQTWEFTGDVYDLSMFMIADNGTSEVTTQVFRSKYYAISTGKLMELLNSAGFSDVKQAECDHYQPIIIGTKMG